MIDSYPLHIPEDSTPGQCLATFSTSITALAIELGTFFNLQLSSKHGVHWFEDLKYQRKFHDSKYHQYKGFYDLSWIVNEADLYTDSPLRALLPKNEYQFYPAMRSLLSMRNQWYHDYNPHNMTELRKALNLVKYISEKASLALSDDLVPIMKRVNEIISGSYKSPVTQPVRVEKVEAEKPKPMRQAAVGAAWLGPIGERKIQLTASGSLIDLTRAENVTSELGDLEVNRYFKLWKKLGLDWLWVDQLGSVGANVHGSMRMVGYWGENPDDLEQDPFAKFLLSNTYAYAGDLFYEREQNESLDEHFLGQITKSTLQRGKGIVQEGDVLRVTWDGDLICFSDQGPLYIGEVESEDWFSGHFLLPTPKA